MREVRFRVYHKKLKRMFYPGEFRLKFNRDHKWYVLINPLKAPESPKSVDIMEYTGLKDKNSREIYEGDILRHDLWGITHVIWEHGMFRAIGGEYDVTMADHQLQRTRIIGNIWENPELLKGGEQNDNVQTGRPADSASEPS